MSYTMFSARSLSAPVPLYARHPPHALAALASRRGRPCANAVRGLCTRAPPPRHMAIATGGSSEQPGASLGSRAMSTSIEHEDMSLISGNLKFSAMDREQLLGYVNIVDKPALVGLLVSLASKLRKGKASQAERLFQDPRFQDLVKEVVDLDPTHNAKALVKVLYAFSRMDYEDPVILDQLCDRIFKAVSQKPLPKARVISSALNILSGFHNYQHKELEARLINVACSQINHMGLDLLSLIYQALVRIDRDTYKDVIHRIAKTIQSGVQGNRQMDAKSFLKCLDTLAELDARKHPLVNELAQRAQWLLPSMNSRELSQTLYCLARLHHRHPIIRDLLTQLKPRIPSFQPEDLDVTLQAYHLLKLNDPGMLDSLGDRVLVSYNELRSKRLINVIGTLGLLCPDASLEVRRVLAVQSRRVYKHMTPLNCMKLLVGWLRFTQHTLSTNLIRQIAEHISDSVQQLSAQEVDLLLQELSYDTVAGLAGGAVHHVVQDLHQLLTDRASPAAADR
eukprot:g83162.t1